MLYITLILNKTLRSEILSDLFDTITAILRDQYGVSLHIRRVYDDSVEQPRFIVNDYEPVILNDIPPIETLLKVLLAIDRVSELPINNNVESNYSENQV